MKDKSWREARFVFICPRGSIPDLGSKCWKKYFNNSRSTHVFKGAAQEP